MEDYAIVEICKHGPDPVILALVGMAVGFFIGMNVMLVYIKICGSPFDREDGLEADH